nr:ATP synthase assembly factor FMC1 domain containing protein [Haemonchus contortus]
MLAYFFGAVVKVMASTVEKSALNAFRRIVSELRKSDKSFGRNSVQYKHLVDQMKDHLVTQRVYSKAPQEAEHVANLYATYLSSTRNLKELEKRYRGNERSVEESARLVGLALPEKK